MADVELVIKMPEDVLKRTVFYREFRSVRDCIMTIKALEKAISLPKGHGRLIDERHVVENICEKHGCYGRDNCKSKLDNFCGAWDVVENAPTIIEADAESEETK